MPVTDGDMIPPGKFGDAMPSCVKSADIGGKSRAGVGGMKREDSGAVGDPESQGEGDRPMPLSLPMLELMKEEREKG